MKVYKTQAEVEKDVVNNVLTINEDVKFECSIEIEAKIVIKGNINAGDINARDINAGDINAREILYYAFCCVYKNILCISIKAKRRIARPPVCLDGKLTIKEGTK